MRRYLILVLVIGICGATNYITNGDFEQALSVGWIQSVSGTGSIIVRGTTYDPDPDYEVYLYRPTGNGFAQLEQTADIPTTNIDFTVAAKLYAWDNNVGAWGVGAVVVAYLDDSSSLLGETRICHRSIGCPWQDGPDCHIIDVNDDLWHTYDFNIAQELANIPAVNPSDVAKVKVSLLAYTLDC